MPDNTLLNWLDRLGYSAEAASLHISGNDVLGTHPYSVEIKALLQPTDAIHAQAVFDIEGVPTIAFVGPTNQPLTSDDLDILRKRVWNQNLISVVLDVSSDSATAYPSRKLDAIGEQLLLRDARPDGPFSVLDFVTASVSERLPSWFDVNAKVDRKLLANLSATASKLAESGFSRGHAVPLQLAEQLLGQLLFVSYLEHREIVGTTYRERRNVRNLHDLVSSGDRTGIRALIDCLRSDFNGDFLGDDRHDSWSVLNDEGLKTVDQFLRKTDLKTGQGSFWNYDFSYIPVELLSGVYESFLTPEQQEADGAFYTPRSLANFVVDQALLTSSALEDETVFDGACGSGILLTTAYRRLISFAETRASRQLTFKERVALLQTQIFGGDTNPMACRVTAFSLYLSLLEGLNPSDILAAQEVEGVKLPTLAGKNLMSGDVGDFFRDDHGFAGRKFSLIISNPPWSEPAESSLTSADAWAARAGKLIVRRQTAGAYALRAAEYLAESGRVCLIMPVGQFLGRSSARFVRDMFFEFRPLRLINFGDLQGLVFPTAENTCQVFVGQLRYPSTSGVPAQETFDYLVPKADLSLALGRLTMQSADKHTVQTQRVLDDSHLLVTLMWGDANDLAILTRLGSRGTFSSYWKGPDRRWVTRKGIHLVDKSRDAVDSAPLKEIPYLPITALKNGLPILCQQMLTDWPSDRDSVVGLSESIWNVFDGPRVLFPDGFSKEDACVRAAYYDGPASFTNSIGVISGPEEDASLLQLVAVYLRSSLARYFLMMRGWKMLCERNGVHLADVEAFPFFGVDEAPDPKAALEALAEISGHMTALGQMNDAEARDRYGDVGKQLDTAIFRYFGLDERERLLIKETVDLLLPSVRPRSFKSLKTPAQRSASSSDFDKYARALGSELTSWRIRMGGQGGFKVELAYIGARRVASFAVVKLSVIPNGDKEPSHSVKEDEALVFSMLKALQAAGLRIVPSGDSLALIPDTYIWHDGACFIVRPSTRRSWSYRQALRDAEHLVREVQNPVATGIGA